MRGPDIYLYVEKFELTSALLRLPQIAVKHTSRVKEVTCDMPRCVDGHLEAPRHEDSNIARARRVIGGDRSIGSAHEAVIRAARIGVNSRDHPSRIDSPGVGLMCARRPEAGKRAGCRAHKAILQSVVVLVPSRDRTRSVDHPGTICHSTRFA